MVLAWLLPDRQPAPAAPRRRAPRGRPDLVVGRLRRSVAGRLSAPAQRHRPDDGERRTRDHRPARRDDRAPTGRAGRLDLRPRLRSRRPEPGLARRRRLRGPSPLLARGGGHAREAGRLPRLRSSGVHQAGRVSRGNRPVRSRHPAGAALDAGAEVADRRSAGAGRSRAAGAPAGDGAAARTSAGLAPPTSVRPRS